VFIGLGAWPIIEASQARLKDENDGPGGILPSPSALRDLLVATGVDGGLEFEVALCKDWTWVYVERLLVEYIYPFMRFRARVLEKEMGKPTTVSENQSFSARHVMIF
jgi:hypothetical protein